MESALSIALSKSVQNDINKLLSEVSQKISKEDKAATFNREVILSNLYHKQAVDAKLCSSVLATEAFQSSTDKSVNYSWLCSPLTMRPLAIQTTESILDDEIISWIRQRAHEIWVKPTEETTSRFTYQRKGNYEVHLTDLLQHTTDQYAKDGIHHALTKRIYPTIRNAFGSSLVDDESSIFLSVYDAIVIRYNATEASVGIDSGGGAGQPLHRDLGLVSVNIMLNDQAEFKGGGTFFEHQLESTLLETADGTTLPSPLKPLQPGHALMHLSSDRHAGASTKSGVRDILVFFITATRTDQTAPMLERSARLKSAARPDCLACEDQNIESDGSFRAAVCRARYHSLSVESVPEDGEAWQYLGMALWDICNTLFPDINPQNMPMSNRLTEACLACFDQAFKYTPFDARLYNNLALILEEKSSSLDLMKYGSHHGEIVNCYDTALKLHKTSQAAGCDVGLEYKSVLLNYGLYLANQDDFERADHFLTKLLADEEHVMTQNKTDEFRQFQIQQNAQSLSDFCKSQMGGAK
jgi:hypothetical protein